MYFCAGQTNSGMTPGFLHLTVLSREEAIEAPPTNVTVPPGAAAVLSCRTHLALHGHMSWVRIYPETGRVEELANSTEVYREVWLRDLKLCPDLICRLVDSIKLFIGPNPDGNSL